MHHAVHCIRHALIRSLDIGSIWLTENFINILVFFLFTYFFYKEIKPWIFVKQVFPVNQMRGREKNSTNCSTVLTMYCTKLLREYVAVNYTWIFVYLCSIYYTPNIYIYLQKIKGSTSETLGLLTFLCIYFFYSLFFKNNKPILISFIHQE